MEMERGCAVPAEQHRAGGKERKRREWGRKKKKA